MAKNSKNEINKSTFQLRKTHSASLRYCWWCLVISISLTQFPSNHFLELKEFWIESLGHLVIDVHLKHKHTEVWINYVWMKCLKQHITWPFHIFAAWAASPWERLASCYSLVEAECSLFRGLTSNCDTLLLDPETLAFEETASAVKKDKRAGIHFYCASIAEFWTHKLFFIWTLHSTGGQRTSASAPLNGVSVNVLVKILICPAQEEKHVHTITEIMFGTEMLELTK